MPRRVSVPIQITAEERQELRKLRERHAGKRSWVRAEVVLRAAGGQPNYSIAKELGISRNTVKHWRFRFARERFAGLDTRPIPGRPRKARAFKTAIAERAVTHSTVVNTVVKTVVKTAGKIAKVAAASSDVGMAT